MPDENPVKSTVDAVTGLVQAVPIYEDALRPAAKELGKGLLVVAKTVNVALAPLGGLVWGYEKFREFVDTTLAEKLKNVPANQINTPPAHIAVPALEALRYTGDQAELRN